MKRSKSIRLVLLGGVSAGALAGLTGLTGCAPQKPAISTENVYANDFYIPGAGYYHAPFQGWYAMPYNYCDANTGRFYFGGNWGPQPYESIVNISSPTLQAAQAAQTARTDISRGGFGSTGGRYYNGGSGFHS